MKNIVFAIFKYFPYGGLQRDMLRIAAELLKRKHLVTVYCHKWEGEIPDGIRVVKLKCRGLSNHTFAEAFATKLHAALKTEPHDALVAFNRLPKADFYFAGDNPFYLTSLRNVGRFWSRILPRYRTFTAQERSIFSPNAKTIILYLTPRQKDEYIAVYHTQEERFRLLPPGIPPDRKRPADAEVRRHAKRRELGVGEDETMLLQVGSGYRTKGVEGTITAVASLPEDYQEKCRLFIAGRGRKKPFRKLASRLGADDRIEFLGERDDVPDLLLAADLLVHPARNEATGTVLIEALAAGTPVLCSDNCGFAPFVAESGGIVLNSSFDQRDLNHALLLTVSTQERINDLKEAALAYGLAADFYRRAEAAAAIISGEQV